MSAPAVYIPGSAVDAQGLLSRYLPPLPRGVASAWLRANAEPGAWVLDPFGTAPAIVVEAARAGYRVLVAANNPVTRFLIDLAAQPPSEAELRATLAGLAAARKGEERLEPHILELYATQCQECGQEVSAEAFLWEREAGVPFARIYRCRSCGDAGERPVTAGDLAKAAQFSRTGLHRARALERITAREDPDRVHVEEALAAYLPRAVYALFTIINRLEGIPAGPAGPSPGNRQLSALLLHACDEANTLWPHPTARARPRQLIVPTRLRENNVWMALEKAIDLHSSAMPAVALTAWPEVPPEGGGVTIFEGRIHDLVERLRSSQASPVQFGAVLAALPRPNQAFWTLSALWAGWLWGREALGAYKQVLRRRRYDWSWHTTALHAAMRGMATLLAPETPLFGSIGEVEPGFLASASISAQAAGFELDGLALRSESGQAQITWRSEKPAGPDRPGKPGRRIAKEQIEQVAVEAGKGHLQARGEPASYQVLQAAALSALAGAGLLAQPSAAPGEVYNDVQEALSQAFTFRNGFLRYGGSDKSPETGSWWLRAAGRWETPLADRIEMAVVEFLQKNPGCTFEELDTAICRQFPGLFTPDAELMQIVVDSYGQEDPANKGKLSLQAADSPALRRAEIDELGKCLHLLGERLGFSTSGEGPLLWREAKAGEAYAFYVMAATNFGAIVLQEERQAPRKVIVLPGGRARLALAKLRRNPHLSRLMAEGWLFLKYRHLRRLLETPGLNRGNFEDQLALDPLTDSAPQMRLL